MPWLLAGLLAWLGVFGAGGLVPREVQEKEKMVPNQGIHRSARWAITVGLPVGLVVGLAIGWFMGLTPRLYGSSSRIDELNSGLVLALLFGSGLALRVGGLACLSHYALRLVLWRTGVLPLDCVRFLDYAAERLFLYRAGGGYVFVHPLLQAYFAEQPGATRAERPPNEATAIPIQRLARLTLHNDDHNTMPDVERALRQSIPGMTEAAAHDLMWETHTSGKAVVATCAPHLAERYKQRLCAFGLTATVEQD